MADLLCRIYRKLAECPGATSACNRRHLPRRPSLERPLAKRAFYQPRSQHAELVPKGLKVISVGWSRCLGSCGAAGPAAARSLDDAMERTEGAAGLEYQARCDESVASGCVGRQLPGVGRLSVSQLLKRR